MVKIMLIQPASNMMKNKKEGKPFLPPLGLMYIAGTLKANGYKDIKILDCMAEGFYNESEFRKDYIRYGLSPEEIKKRIKEYNPDIVGTSIMCSLRRYQAYEICEIAKGINKEIITVVGGCHPTCFPKEALKRRSVDFAILGEGEEPFLKLVQCFDSKKKWGITMLQMEKFPKEGIAYKSYHGSIPLEDSYDIIVKPQKTWKKNIDKIPFPAHDLIDLDMYHNLWKKEGYQVYEAKKFTMSVMARGCPNKCISGDTLVNTVEGNIPIKDLIGRRKIGIYTYDSKTKKVFITDAINIRKTGVRNVVRVHFDDGTYIDCTPDHKFLTFKNGNQHSLLREYETEAKDLKPKMSVRAIKLYDQTAGYTTISWGRKSRELQHRLVAEYMLGRNLTDDEWIHHIDKNKKNNLPENIKVIIKHNHAEEHPEISERMKKDNPVKYLTSKAREKIYEKTRGRKQTLQERINHRNSMIGKNNHNYKEGKYANKVSRISKIAKEKGLRDREINHRVVYIEKLIGLREVYDLEVPATSWFFANNVLIHNCHHCPHNVLFPGYRARSAKNLFKEVKWCYSLDIREIQYHEYNGLVNWSIVEEFCHLMIDSGIAKDFRWGWPIGVWLKALNREKLKLMRKAGMDYLCLAIESHDQAKLDKVMSGKDVDLKHTLNVIKWGREFGYQLHAFFMLGLEGQTKLDIEKTIEFSKTLDLDSASFFIAQPLPGTPFWEYCTKNKLFYDNFDTFHLRYGKSNHKIKGVSRKELEHYRHRARKEFVESRVKQGRKPMKGKRGSDYLERRCC